jgi:DNA-binding NarL/FixJ family response regulator
VTGLIPNARLVLFDDGRQIGGLTTDSGDPPAATAMIDFFEGLTSQEAHVATSPTGGIEGVLSAREVEVLRLLAAGKSNQEIADELVISVNTVIRHVSNVFGKTGVTNRAQATAYAMRNGLA